MTTIENSKEGTVEKNSKTVTISSKTRKLLSTYAQLMDIFDIYTEAVTEKHGEPLADEELEPFRTAYINMTNEMEKIISTIMFMNVNSTNCKEI